MFVILFGTYSPRLVLYDKFAHVNKLFRLKCISIFILLGDWGRNGHSYVVTGLINETEVKNRNSISWLLSNNDL